MSAGYRVRDTIIVSSVPSVVVRIVKSQTRGQRTRETLIGQDNPKKLSQSPKIQLLYIVLLQIYKLSVNQSIVNYPRVHPRKARSQNRFAKMATDLEKPKGLICKSAGVLSKESG